MFTLRRHIADERLYEMAVPAQAPVPVRILARSAGEADHMRGCARCANLADSFAALEGELRLPWTLGRVAAQPAQSATVDARPVAIAGAAALLLIVGVVVVISVPRPGSLAGSVATSPPTVDDVLVGQGVTAGNEWAVRNSYDGREICSTMTSDGFRQSQSCVPYGAGNTPGDIGIFVDLRKEWAVVEGFVDPAVRRVRVVLANGSVEGLTVDLSPIGLNARAFSIGVEPADAMKIVIYLAADGSEVARQSMDRSLLPSHDPFPSQCPTGEVPCVVHLSPRP